MAMASRTGSVAVACAAASAGRRQGEPSASAASAPVSAAGAGRAGEARAVGDPRQQFAGGGDRVGGDDQAVIAERDDIGAGRRRGEDGARERQAGLPDRGCGGNDAVEAGEAGGDRGRRIGAHGERHGLDAMHMEHDRLRKRRMHGGLDRGARAVRVACRRRRNRVAFAARGSSAATASRSGSSATGRKMRRSSASASQVPEALIHIWPPDFSEVLPPAACVTSGSRRAPPTGGQAPRAPDGSATSILPDHMKRPRGAWVHAARRLASAQKSNWVMLVLSKMKGDAEQDLGAVRRPGVRRACRPSPTLVAGLERTVGHGAQRVERRIAEVDRVPEHDRLDAVLLDIGLHRVRRGEADDGDLAAVDRPASRLRRQPASRSTSCRRCP